MIKVTNKINGFKVEGHALFANYGNDIVCSAVSVTTIGVINEIEKLSSKDNIKLFQDSDKGVIDFEVQNLDVPIKVLLGFFKNTLNDLEINYSNHIKIIK